MQTPRTVTSFTPFLIDTLFFSKNFQQQSLTFNTSLEIQLDWLFVGLLEMAWKDLSNQSNIFSFHEELRIS